MRYLDTNTEDGEVKPKFTSRAKLGSNVVLLPTAGKIRQQPAAPLIIF